MLAGVSVASAQSAVPPLWESLTPGKYAVGYRVDFAADRTRTWRITHHYETAPTVDVDGRPVRISIWYPAQPGARSPRMPFGEYARGKAPPAFAAFGRRLAQRDSVILSLNVSPDDIKRLLRTPTAVHENAAPARGRFPLVLMIAGLNAETSAQAVLAELLASYGYVVATVPWTGRSDDQFDARTDATALEASTRDVEFAWSRLRTRPDVDSRHSAVVGHSLGGVIALIMAMRNTDIEAVIGLDGSYGFSGVTALTGFYGFAPQRMTAAFLDLRKAAGEQNTVLDLGVERAFYYSDRWFVTLRHIRHSEFSTYSLISDVFHEPPIPPQFQSPGWSRGKASQRYQDACRMVLAFLDAKLKGDSTGIPRLTALVGGSGGAAMTHEVALPPPPSPAELVAIAARDGFDAATDVVRRYAREAPGDPIVPEADLNSLGYARVQSGHTMEGLLAFRLAIYGHPTSANAYDSYGDGLLASGDTAHARAAYARALVLAPLDSTMSPSARASLMQGDSAHLGALAPSGKDNH